MNVNKIAKYVTYDEYFKTRNSPQELTQELPQELPEVKVKSDLSKWLLLGGCVVFSYYLWRKIK